MRGILQDARFALRQFMARPLFTVTAIATIAIGIGANVSIFSVVNSLLLNPLPFADADRLAFLWRASASSELLLSPDGALLEALRAGATTVESIEAWTTDDVVVDDGGGPRVASAAAITEGLLTALRLSPGIGRPFTRTDEAQGADPVLMVSHAYWQSALGGRPDALGHTLTVDGVSHTIVAVAPPTLVLPSGTLETPDVLRPLRRNAEGRIDGRGYRTLLRLRDGVSRDAAEAELSALTARHAEDTGNADFPAARVRTPSEMLGSNIQRALLVLYGAVAFVLLIACANVANLLLVRGVARESEMAVRAALGAGRGRLIRQVVVESLLLGMAGGIAGLIFAQWALDLILTIRPESLRELERARIDGRVTAYAAVLAVGTSVLFGLLPALRITRDALTGRARNRAVAGGRATRHIASALIGTEVALSLVLLVGAGLLVRTFVTLQATPVHFQPQGLWSVTVERPPRPGQEEPRGAFVESVREAVAAVPGVRDALAVLGVPPEYGVSFGALALDGEPPAEGAPAIFATNFVPSDYFRMLGIQFVEGRAFTDEEGDEVVVVGDAFARRFFEGSALGHRIRLGEDAAWRTIVGVARDLPAHGLARSATGYDQLHFPRGIYPANTILVATDLPAAALADAVRAAVANVDPTAAVARMRTLEEQLARSLDPQRFNLTLLLVLALLATLLSAVGLYGVVGMAVAERTREIGIRRALGATDAGVVRLAIGIGMRPAAAGLGAGLIAALALTRLLSALLHGTSPRDPHTLAVVPVLLAAVALLASWLPGRRAARIDPVDALRAE